MAVCLALQYERDDALLAEIRHAARLSLAVLSSALIVSASFMATTLATREFVVPELDLQPTWWLAACAGLVVAVPWIRVVRRRSVVHRHFGFAEYASLTALSASNLISLVAVCVAVIIWNTTWTRRPGTILFFSKADVLMLVYGFPIIAASALAVLGVLIELWRDQWHPRLTAIACTWLSVNWLAVSFCHAAFKNW